MLSSVSRPAWQKAPFIRLLIPFITGILLQVYTSPPSFTGWTILLSASLVYFILSVFKLAVQYNLRRYTGACIHAWLLATGMLLAFHNDIRTNPAWINNYYSEGNTVLATLEEPLSEKTKSYKANASVRVVIRSNGASIFVKGNVLLYFQKDPSLSRLHYGSQIVFKKSLQPIKNSGNPGSFNYQRVCYFRNISYQVFLKPKDFVVLKIDNQNLFKKFLFAIRAKFVDILSKNISGEKESGLAEAMLIGYKDDLDKDLVQSYSNTGVVHIIAISGLHLALIYALLTWLCKPLGRRNSWAQWLRPVLIIAGLWLFSLAAGGSASVLRSAVMFTCLVTGDSLSRRISIYHSLALSAFVLLCYDPFLLWDAGFQLSYAAVVSLALFMKPLYDRWYCKNKMQDLAWKLVAVTLAAQVLTVPLCIYHFHQFPTFFLVANLVAVPVSGIILMGELLLCGLSCIPAVAKLVGTALHWIIFFLNSFIERTDALPGSALKGFQVTTLQLICLYLFITGLLFWLLYKKKTGIVWALPALLVFTGIRTGSFWKASQQQQLIIYNIPQHQAIDFIEGRKYVFKGDSLLLHDDFVQSFHLNPARVLYRISPTDSLESLITSKHFICFGNKVLLLADSSLSLQPTKEKIRVDIVLLTKNPPFTIQRLTKTITSRLIIMDASNTAWKINRWKQECRENGVAFYSIPDQGAFVLPLQ
jgi:competence protein ComEC